MFLIPSTVRVFICNEPTDMRRSFDSLSGMVRDFLGGDPLSGHFFVFRSRRGDRVKVLHFDRTGFCLWYKRLEEGTFSFPRGSGRSIEVDATEFGLMLEGIDLAGSARQRRNRLPGTERAATI